ncbi:MAG: hypothetical protein ACKO23_04910 [Gemmataceae bacterium]
MRMVAGLAGLILSISCLSAQTPVVSSKSFIGTEAGLAARPTEAKEKDGSATLEILQTFQPKELRIGWNNRRWQIMAGSQVLRDFGPNEQDARLILQTIRELGLSQHAVIGSPQPILEYWLVNGKAPRSISTPDMKKIVVDLDTLRVEHLHGQWGLRDNSRVLFLFGSNQDLAYHTKAIFLKYRFNEIALVGRQSGLMYVPMNKQMAISNEVLKTASMRGGRAAGSPEPNLADGKSFRTSKFGTTGASQAAGGIGGLDVERSRIGGLPPLKQTSSQSERNGFRPVSWQNKGAMTQSVLHEPLEERIVIDWRRVQLKQDQGDWKLVAGGTILNNFGANQFAGQQALAVLRHYRFNEQWRIGDPRNPEQTYYIASQQAPRGMIMGLPAEEIAAEKMEIRRVDEGFALAQGAKVVLPLGDQERDAKRILESIQRNKCDRVCRLGEPGKANMTFLVRSR